MELIPFLIPEECMAESDAGFREKCALCESVPSARLKGKTCLHLPASTLRFTLLGSEVVLQRRYRDSLREFWSTRLEQYRCHDI